jgi:uncharacterized protein YgbK (DUF1537 family)
MALTAASALAIVADDLTGACDTGTLFARTAPVPVSLWPAPPVAGPVLVVDTESRSAAAEEAAARVRAVASGLAAPRVFKKIDSTLRGRIGEEVDAVLAATGARGAVLTPAFPAQGRTVVDRVLSVDGVPVARTAVAADPDFPDGKCSDVVECLRKTLDRPIGWIPLAQVRGGDLELGARLARLEGIVAVADAETDEDLAALVDAALALEPPPLLVGAAGLARAVAARLGLLGEPPALPRGDRWLVVAGSRHPATRRQVAEARRAGLRVLATGEAELPDRGGAAVELARQARRLLEEESFDLVVVTGGETALALWRELEGERMDLVGAPAPGLSLGYLRTPRHPALAILTKAGGFGAPDLLASLFREACP